MCFVLLFTFLNSFVVVHDIALVTSKINKRINQAQITCKIKRNILKPIKYLFSKINQQNAVIN